MNVRVFWIILCCGWALFWFVLGFFTFLIAWIGVPLSLLAILIPVGAGAEAGGISMLPWWAVLGIATVTLVCGAIIGFVAAVAVEAGGISMLPWWAVLGIATVSLVCGAILGFVAAVIVIVRDEPGSPVGRPG